MKLDAPFLFLSGIVNDIVRYPREVFGMLGTYQNFRWQARVRGFVPHEDIFQAVPNWRDVKVVVQALAEIPFMGTEEGRYNSATTLQDAYYLALLLKSTKARTVVEFGTSFGHAALLFALNTPDDAVILTTDIQTDNPTVGEVYRGRPEAAKIKQSYQSTQGWNLAGYRRACDFVFIDASHEYGDVIADSKIALSLVAPGGVIAWHDYTFRFRHGVVRALDELRKKEGCDIRHLRYSNVSYLRVEE